MLHVRMATEADVAHVRAHPSRADGWDRAGLGRRHELAAGIAWDDVAAGPAWCIACPGQPICVFGAAPVRPGVAEVWSLTAAHAARHPQAFTRLGRRCMSRLVGGGVYHRLEAWCRADGDAARWLALLGFRCEGRLRRAFDDGADILVMALLA